MCRWRLTVLSAGMVGYLGSRSANQLVISPYRAAFGINDVRLALVERARKFCTTYPRAQADISETTLRQVVGGRVLQSVISDREGLAQEVAEIVSPPSHPLSCICRS